MQPIEKPLASLSGSHAGHNLGQKTDDQHNTIDPNQDQLVTQGDYKDS